MTMYEAQQCARKNLSQKRYLHTQNVADCARKLALRWGADPEKTEMAAWLHDIMKEMSREDLLRILHQDDIMAGSTKARPLPVWHGTCAAIYAKHTLGICDEEMLSAVSCHTTGKANMTTMEKVVFLADAISAERDYNGVEELRELSMKNLDMAVMEIMKENIRHLQRKGKELDDDTIEALSYLEKELKL